MVLGRHNLLAHVVQGLLCGAMVWVICPRPKDIVSNSMERVLGDTENTLDVSTETFHRQGIWVRRSLDLWGW